MSVYQNKPIKDWDDADKPREKLKERGVSALTDAELIALLLSTGTREHSVVDLARELLKNIGGLIGLARADANQLLKTKGIGDAKATTILAAFELGRRKAQSVGYEFRVNGSPAVADYLQAKIGDEAQEVFHVLFLNRNNVVIGDKSLFRGGVSATVVDPKVVFREALAHLASSIIVAHNHPSGSLAPSRADEDITRQLVAAGKLLEITVLDHLIVTSHGYYSFADEGKMG